jgi:hypothetical protein
MQANVSAIFQLKYTQKAQIFDASVARLEVTTDFPSALYGTVVDGLDWDLTAPLTGAESLHLGQDVHMTPQAAKVLGQTLAKSHTAEVCRLDDDDLVRSGTAGTECVHLTVFQYDTWIGIRDY